MNLQLRAVYGERRLERLLGAGIGGGLGSQREGVYCEGYLEGCIASHYPKSPD